MARPACTSEASQKSAWAKQASGLEVWAAQGFASAPTAGGPRPERLGLQDGSGNACRAGYAESQAHRRPCRKRRSKHPATASRPYGRTFLLQPRSHDSAAWPQAQALPDDRRALWRGSRLRRFRQRCCLRAGRAQRPQPPPSRPPRAPAQPAPIFERNAS